MAKNVSIQTMQNLIKLRNLLDNIGQASYQYHILKKKFPLELIDDPNEAKELSKAYGEIIKNVISVTQQYGQTA